MRAFLFTLLFLLGVTLVVIAQSAPAKGPELKAITTPDQIAPQPKVIGAEAEIVLKNVFGVEQKLSALRGSRDGGGMTLSTQPLDQIATFLDQVSPFAPQERGITIAYKK
jgi:hypothetical protein